MKKSKFEDDNLFDFLICQTFDNLVVFLNMIIFIEGVLQKRTSRKVN